MNLTARTSLLVLLARVRPQLWELLFPHVPYLSEGSRHAMAAMVIKTLTREINDPNVVKKLHSTAKRLFEAGAKSMDYDLDDWCPTRPRPHFPFPPRPWPDPGSDIFGPFPEPWRGMGLGEEVMLNPQPLPPVAVNAHYGALLILLAEAVSVANVAERLREIGTSLSGELQAERQ